MVKPICTIGVPDLDYDKFQDLTLSTKSLSEEYHVLLLPVQGKRYFINVYHVKDFSSVEYAEMKKLILDKINDHGKK